MIFKNNLETTVKATYRENNAQYKTELHKLPATKNNYRHRLSLS